MRNQILVALLGIAAMLTGCSQENGTLAPSESKTASFNVSVDGGVQTRANVTDLTRYVMEIYKGATATGTPEVHKEQATGTFTDVVLDNAQQYTILFWADYGTPSTDGTHPAANEYNAADLKAAKVALQPTAAAYAGLSRFTVGTDNEAAYTAVTLTHAVAQVNFKQTEALTSATNTLVVKYPKSYSLNVDDNAVTEVAGEVTRTYTYDSKAIGTLGTDYIIAATGTPKTMFDITATLNSETPQAVSNVPFERNFKTNISGPYSNIYDATMTVTCDDAWETKDFEETIKVPITWADGNLIADGENNAKIGQSGDGNLFFQFGSLVGWNTTGTASIVVKPNDYQGDTSWNSTWTGDATTDNAATGTGDPCRYYLKGTWRLPTKAEFVELYKANTGWTGPWSWNADAKLASNSISGMTLPAWGYRTTAGKIAGSTTPTGAYWSSTIADDDTKSFFLCFAFDTPLSALNNIRANALAVRCVHD